ncbi:MAG TPA: M56 family metallopeptidase [Gemmatimonadaceae bacterium]|nr:M56 family metallopeptidase [Gemmatimonadaceae bacterium]
MIGAWMAYTVVVTALIAGAALAAEYLARALGRPTRWVWAAAIVAALSISIFAYRRVLRPSAPPSPPRAAVLGADAASGATPGVRQFEAGPAPTPSASRFGARDAAARAGGIVARAYDATIGRAAVRIARWNAALAAAWVVASLAMLGYLIVAIARIRLLSRTLERGMASGVPVLVSHDVGPALVGLVTPRIIVPRWVLELPDDQCRAIILHEQEHADARDPVLLVLALIALLVQPWNVALWVIAARTRFAAEADCDARVLRRRGDAREYGRLLLAVYERTTAGLLPRAALVERRSNLERRIRRIAGGAPRLVSLGGSLACAGVIVCAAIAWSTPVRSSSAVVRGDAVRSVAVATASEFRPTCAPGDRNPGPDVEKLQGWAREFYPQIMRDSTNARKMVIGFVLDSTCAVVRHTAAAYPAQVHDADDLFADIFPDIREHPWMLGIADGAKFPNTRGTGHDRVTISFAMFWAPMRVVSDQFTACGIGAKECAFDGQVLIRLIDSMHVVVAVRSVDATSDQDATGQTFLVTALAPYPRLLARSLAFGHVEFGGSWVYVSNPQRDDPSILIGEPKPDVAARPQFARAVHFGSWRGVAHYWGASQMTFDQIRRLQPATACDESGECFAVDGKTWRFP